MTAERRNRLLLSRSLSVCLFVGVLSAGCASLRLPPNPPQFSLSEGREFAQDGVEVRAMAVQGRELNWEIFDENMPALGIAPVWVEVKNNRSLPFDLAQSWWRLGVDGRSLKTMSTREVLDRYYAGRRIRMYSTGIDATTRSRLDRLMLAGGAVAPATKLEGFLFFRIDPQLGPGWAERAVLTARGVRLDRNTTTDIELPLKYANP